MDLGRVSSCNSNQGGDSVWSQQCTVGVLIRSNWFGGPGGIPLIGCSRNLIKLEKKKKG